MKKKEEPTRSLENLSFDAESNNSLCFSCLKYNFSCPIEPSERVYSCVEYKPKKQI